MTSLSEIVDVVIGVDTHVHDPQRRRHRRPHRRRPRPSSPSRRPPTATSSSSAFADEHSGLRAWAIEGTGGHGAGLTRLLRSPRELVVELDRPERPKRRNGAKSDPLDAIRAAREALSRAKLGTPRSAGDRQALSVLLAARRSAVESAGDAQRQVFSLVIAAPEVLRTKFRGQKIPAMLSAAARLRVSSAWDVETATTATVLRDLARRSVELSAEAARHEKAILAIVRSWRPELLDQPGVGPIVAATLLCAWSHPGRVRSEAAFAMLGRRRLRSRPTAARPPTASVSTATATASSTGRSTPSCSARLRYDKTTKAYVEAPHRRRQDPREIKRCLKRYVARDFYRLLENPPSAA